MDVLNMNKFEQMIFLIFVSKYILYLYPKFNVIFYY